MKYYTLYNKTTGQILSSCFTETEQKETDSIGVLKEYACSDQYVNVFTKELVCIPPKEWDYQVFDFVTKSYSNNVPMLLNYRNSLLQSSDWTQLPNNPLSPEKQSEWAVYRQQLRDVTSQPNYPTIVNWPETPV